MTGTPLLKKTPIELKADEILKKLDTGEAEVLPRANAITYDTVLNAFTLSHEERTWADVLGSAISDYRIDGGVSNAEALSRLWDKAKANRCVSSNYESRIGSEANKHAERSSSSSLVTLYDSIIVHPVIRKVSRKLYSDGHYSPAIFEAFKALNYMVKEKSGESGDGQDLMAKTFNEDKPTLRLNSMSSSSDKDEQAGFRFLYMGAMRGIRNPKAHDFVGQRDPIRTLHYLALANLLATRIDESRIVRS
jgi:uncharacterized protein (TIGR02391 family)